MRIAIALLTFVFLLASASSSDAAIIVTSTFNQTSGTLTSPTVTYRLTTSLTTSGSTSNRANSFGVSVTLSGGTFSNIVPQTLPPGGMVGFDGEFSFGSGLSVSGLTVSLIGRSNSETDFSISPGAGTRFFDFDVTVTRPGAGTDNLLATISALSFAGDLSGPGSIATNLGGTGFSTGAANTVGTPVLGVTLSSGSASITAVPEPSSVAMVTVAACLAFGLRMRKRSK